MPAKTSPFCQQSSFKKYGFQSQIQRYKCKVCDKTVMLSHRLNADKIWADYTSGKQTYKQLAERYNCFVRTIQRYIEKAPKTALK